MNKHEQAERIIKTHVVWSLGAGLLPLPFVDLAAVTVVQLDMLKQLCRLYEVDYSESEGKVFLAALTGGTLARLGATLIKALPGVGTLLGGVSMSVMSGASTYAVAKVAIRHFESGGNSFNFDLNASKKMYAEEFEEGKEYASTLEEERKASKKSGDAEEIIKRLEKLAELKEKGIITAEEFESKKQKLLDQL